MAVPWSKYVTPRRVLVGLTAGFTMVLLLLGLACFIAVRGTRAIQTDAENIIREELTVARLLNQVQAEENTMSLVLHQLVQPGQRLDSANILRQLDESDTAIERATMATRHTSESQRWAELAAAARLFTLAARSAIARQDRPEATIQSLFKMHGEVVRRVQDLVTASTQRALQTDNELVSRSRELADESMALLGTCFVLALLSATVTIRVTRGSVERVEWQAGELGRISWHMLQTQEQAARRFSHELHDELGQSLAAIKANLSAMNSANLDARRSDCVDVVDEAIANVRELAQLLRPVILDDFGLDAALRWLTEKFSQRTNIPVRYESNLTMRLDEEAETHLFRIAQEALTNVARHSQATEVSVSLVCDGSSVELTIEDNGRGFTADGRNANSSLGMVGMRARARQAGGELTISSAKVGGVRILVEIPAPGVACA